MNDISPVSQPKHAALNGVQRNGSHQGDSKAPTRGADRVELSQAAQELSKNNQSAEIRHDLVARVRSEIEAGTYESSQKIDSAIERLSQDLV